LVTQQGADELCGLFKTGGGRKSAAGINHLPIDELTRFIDAFKSSINKPRYQDMHCTYPDKFRH
jgi:hypothetical protein